MSDPNRKECSYSEKPNNSDTISRQAAIDAIKREQSLVERPITETRWFDLGLRKAQEVLSELPSAQFGQRYTNEELMIFQHGISLSLLSKRSAQHWQYDEDTATKIEFLERLYEKVREDINQG